MPCWQDADIPPFPKFLDMEAFFPLYVGRAEMDWGKMTEPLGEYKAKYPDGRTDMIRASWKIRFKNGHEGKKKSFVAFFLALGVVFQFNSIP